MRTIIFLFLSMSSVRSVYAQAKDSNDTLLAKGVDSVTVKAYISSSQKSYLSEVQGTYIFSGKKTESVNLLQTDADIANKIGRQVFAKVPGVFVYDMDGSGNQVNIALRGLDPHRGWEFNIRKDGIITNSDMYGYPASHYNMPLESIDHIELVRGTGSLQYGAQFGGMLNYINKRGDSTKPFSFESITTAGSYHLLSSYLAVGGRVGNFSYYAYVNKKTRDGYRQNEHTNSEAESVIINYEPSADFSVRLEWARSAYEYRMPGPLTDQQFYADPAQASRTRNYFNPDIHVPSVTLNWQIADQTRLRLSSSAVLGKRNSVLFDKPTNVADTINKTTFQYNNRQVDIDEFNSYTTELRLLQEYHAGKQTSVLAAGIQYMNNDLHRQQLGVGTTGSDFDLSLVTPGWGRDIHFKTKNIALFAENKFQVLKQLSITLGARLESGQTDLTGLINYYPGNQVPVSIEHHFPLYAAGFAYKIKESLQLYGGWSQAYRPMIFKDLIPASLYEKVDPTIRDASGYNAEIGFRGNWKFLKWDITGFILQDKNRFGTLAQTDNTGALYLYRTNIGNSLSKGAEIFIQGDWLLGKKTSLTAFTSTALMHARYTEATVKSGNVNRNINGNKVESAPDLTTRNGITLRHHKLHLSVLYSYTAATFADALNTVTPPAATGAVGLVPAYGIVDINAGLKLTDAVEIKMNISNLTNKQYFTKRPMFYPGPGIWPADGRNVNFTIGIKL